MIIRRYLLLLLGAALLAAALPALSGVNQWTPYGSGLWGGGPRQFASANDQTVYAEMAGELYRSTDTGKTWSRRHALVNGNASQVESVAVSANHSAVVWFVSRTQLQLHRSLDSAATATAVAALLPDKTRPYAVWAHPDNPDHATVVSDYATIFYTTDGGRSWNRSSNGNGMTLVQGELPLTLYSYRRAWNGLEPAILVSEDGGVTWRVTAQGLDAEFSSLTPYGEVLAASRVAGGALYAARRSNNALSRADFTLFRSKDQGATWVPLGNLPGRPAAIQPSATVASRVYLVTVGGQIAVSDDFGDNWRGSGSESVQLDANSPDYFRNLFVLTQSGHDTLLYSLKEGCFRSGDSGNAWTAVGPGLVRYDALRWYSESPSGELYAANPYVMFKSADRGLTWAPLQTQSLPFPVATPWSATTGNLLFAPERIATSGMGPLIWGRLARSSDNGMHWTTAKATIPISYQTSPRLAADPLGKRLYVAGISTYAYDGERSLRDANAEHLYVSTDFGDTWRPTSARHSEGFSGTAIDWRQPDTLIAFRVQAGPLISRDAGKNWAAVPGVPAAAGLSPAAYFPPDAGNVIYIVQREVDPKDSYRVYVSDDHGASFRNVGAEQPLAPSAFDGKAHLGSMSRRTPKELVLASTDRSVYRSLDGGDTWQPLPQPPSAGVNALIRVADDRDEWLAGTGSGLYHLEIAPQNGWWWNPQEGGRGFAIERFNDRVFIAGFLYNSEGQPLWFTASGPLNVDVFEAPMQTFRSGQTLDGTYRAPTVAESLGTLKMKFLSATKATLSWPGGELQVERYPIVPGGLQMVQKREHPETGWWWNPAEGGRGFMIEVQGDTAFVGSFMYEPNGQPVWYVGTGRKAGTASFEGAFVRYANGQSLTGPYRPPQVSNGTVADFRIDFNGGQATMKLSNGKTIILERFRKF